MFNLLRPGPMQSLRFLHIPKTAGTTIVHILRAQYRSRDEFAFSGDADDDARRYNALSVQSRERLQLFSGHAPITTGIDRADCCTTITLLREPVSRVQSFCRHVSEGKSPYLLKEFPPARFDLDEFLWSGNDELFNLQTKMLVNHFRSSAPWSAEICDSRVLDRAVRNLFDKVAHFGLQEHFRESVERFRSALGWGPVQYMTRNRVRSGKRLEFREHHLQRIAELNQLDMELYRIAEAQFLSERAEQEPALAMPALAMDARM